MRINYSRGKPSVMPSRADGEASLKESLIGNLRAILRRLRGSA